MILNFSDVNRTSLKASSINVGDALPQVDIELTHTIVASTAIASMDFMPVHHDKDYALAQFAPDAFLNILSSNGFVSKFLTDWAGPECWVKKIAVKLGVPATPHKTLSFTGTVMNKTEQGDEVVIDVSVQGALDTGNHVTGTATITLPKD